VSAATDWSDGVVNLRPGQITTADYADAQSVCEWDWYIWYNVRILKLRHLVVLHCSGIG